jgi:hypothetical protein
MAATSTVPAVLDAVLGAVNTDLPGTVQAFEAWPGPNAAEEMVVFGEVTWEAYEVASIKSGRQHRQETFTIGFEVFVFGKAGTTAALPKAARDRAFVLTESLEDVLAAAPELGTGPGGWVETRLTAAGPRVFEKGWAYRCAGNIHANARLT